MFKILSGVVDVGHILLIMDTKVFHAGQNCGREEETCCWEPQKH